VADETKSLDEWGQVLRLAEKANIAPGTEALIGYARAALDLNRRADAERALAQLSNRKLDDAWSLAQVGWMYTAEHREADAWPLLLEAAKLNDSWAQLAVGKAFYLGRPTIQLKADQTAGLEWIRRSADQCFAYANSFLVVHGYPQSSGCDLQPGAVARPKRVWLASAIEWGFYGFLMSIALGWLGSSRTRARAAGETRQLRHSPSVLILGVLASGIFAGATILSRIHDYGGPPVTDIFLGFAILSLVLVEQYCFARHELTADGMNYGRPMGARGSLKWSEVTHLTYSPGMRWYRLQTSTGAVVRISSMMRGLPEFAREVLARVARPAIDDKAWSMLEATARDGFPKVSSISPMIPP
jgi:hypothetical protein